MRLIGPFRQLLTMDGLPTRGPINDTQLQLVEQAGVVVDQGMVKRVGAFEELAKAVKDVEELDGPCVGMPGMIDAHTHICFGGSRAGDYALRVGGTSYQEILSRGGGIHDTVRHTRSAGLEELASLTADRSNRHLIEGVTTIEVKSGYGLSVEEELRMLHAINKAQARSRADLIPTCLAAHICPKGWKPAEYLSHMAEELLPQLKKLELTNRIDIFVEEEAFSTDLSRTYLEKARQLGFAITIHADQFSVGGSLLAVELHAASADHLEASGHHEIERLGQSNTVAVVLPGASLGLGMPFSPARKLLDAGAILAIATDWNPGSAPMGDLLLQACVLGAAEKLSLAETLAAITSRAAMALQLEDRGVIAPDKKADLTAFRVEDYREILYNQGKIKPDKVWKNGHLIH